eukprot:IDg7447t1
MKSTIVFTFFGLVASAFSASIDIASLKGAIAKSTGAVTAASAADASSGVAAGAIDGPGSVLGSATIGSALAGAMSSPY